MTREVNAHAVVGAEGLAGDRAVISDAVINRSVIVNERGIKRNSAAVAVGGDCHCIHNVVSPREGDFSVALTVHIGSFLAYADTCRGCDGGTITATAGGVDLAAAYIDDCVDIVIRINDRAAAYARARIFILIAVLHAVAAFGCNFAAGDRDGAAAVVGDAADACRAAAAGGCYLAAFDEDLDIINIITADVAGSADTGRVVAAGSVHGAAGDDDPA